MSLASLSDVTDIPTDNLSSSESATGLAVTLEEKTTPSAAKLRRKYTRRKIVNNQSTPDPPINIFERSKRKRNLVPSSTSPTAVTISPHSSPEHTPSKKPHTLDSPSKSPASESEDENYFSPVLDPANPDNMDEILERLIRIESTQETSYSNISEQIANVSKEQKESIAALRSDLDSQKRDYQKSAQALDMKIANLEASLNDKIVSVQNKVDNGMTDSQTILQDVKRAQANLLKKSGVDELNKRIERLEKEAKKRNIIITGLVCNHQNVKEIALDFLNSKFNVSNKNLDIRLLPPRRDNKSRTLVTLDSTTTKFDILGRKRQLKGSNIYIDSDLTHQESEITKRLQLLAKDYRAKGKTVILKHLQLSVNGTWHRLNLDSNSLTPLNPRPITNAESNLHPSMSSIHFNGSSPTSMLTDSSPSKNSNPLLQ